MRREEGDTEEETITLQTYSSFGHVSFFCNIPQSSTVEAHEFCKVLRLDKKSFTEILEIYFLDGRVVLNNLREVCCNLKEKFSFFIICILSAKGTAIKLRED